MMVLRVVGTKKEKSHSSDYIALTRAKLHLKLSKHVVHEKDVCTQMPTCYIYVKAQFATSGSFRSQPAGFEAGYSFYTINMQYEILRRQFVVKNLETTVYTISFAINVGNCSRMIDA